MNTWASAVSPDPSFHSQRLVDPDASSNERQYALAAHLSLLAMNVTGIPILGPILWAVRKNDSPFLDDHGKEAVNFQISILIYAVLSLVLMPVCGIGIATMVAVYVLGIVGCIMGAVAAHRGEFFRYPMSIRLIG